MEKGKKKVENESYRLSDEPPFPVTITATFRLPLITFPNNISGVDSYGDPPVPIPNTAVKPVNAESTWLETAWEDR